MAKSKEKKKKQTKAVKEEIYPDSTNPFENGANGKTEGELYPKEINPFLMKPTKSMKKAKKQQKKREKEEKKAEKKEQKLERKEMKKAGEKNGGKPRQQIVIKAVQINPPENTHSSNNTSTLSRQTQQQRAERPSDFASTLPNYKREDKPELRPAYQTLDHRSPSKDKAESPLLPNKRVLQLKTGLETSNAPQKSLPSRSPELPRRQQYPYNQPQAKQDPQRRPQSLELKRQNLQPPGVSPIQEQRTSSPLVPRHVEDGKMYRSSSVSKRKHGKKKNRKLKGILKKKKKAKEGKQTTFLEDDAVTSNVVMRKPRGGTVKRLQHEVDETKEIVRKSALELIEQRNSQLNLLMENVEKLEESSHGFAMTARDTRLKQHARLTCCGIGARWKICWYICACERGVKRKKKMANNAKAAAPENHELLPTRAEADLGDDTEPYGSATLPATPTVRHPSEEIQRPSSEANSLEEKTLKSGTLGSKLFKVPQAIRGSMPTLSRQSPPETGSLNSMAAVDPQDRKPSSVTAIHELVKKRVERKREEQEKKEKEQKEKQIQQFVSQEYDDEELRKRAASLLRFD